MTPIFAAVNLWEIFLQCDIVGQIITVGLGISSIIAWAVMIGKRNELTNLRYLNMAFEQHIRDQRTILDLPESYRNKRSIPYGDLFADAIDAYERAGYINEQHGINDPRARLEQAENAIQRALARQTLRYEASMIFLASIVSGAPFLGLLGTVWGVMEAFGAVATQQAANITTLAPGISAALLTTVAGLVVAIPSVFGYNYLLGNAKRLIIELENFASSLADRIELEGK